MADDVDPRSVSTSPAVRAGDDSWAPQVEVGTTRLGYSEQHRASFVTVSVRNVSASTLSIVTVQCRFVREDGRVDTTMLLFRDLPAGGEAQGFTYAHSSVPASEVECTQAGVRILMQ